MKQLILLIIILHLIISKQKPITISQYKDFEVLDELHKRIDNLEQYGSNMSYQEVRQYGVSQLRARFQNVFVNIDTQKVDIKHMDMFEDHFCAWRDHIFKMGRKEFPIKEAHELIVTAEHWVENYILDFESI